MKEKASISSDRTQLGIHGMTHAWRLTGGVFVMFWIWTCTIDGAARAADVFNVRDYGAHGDGAKMATAALQRALDTCAAKGGGTVWVPAGRYLTGTLRLRSRVTLHLEAGAVLLGSTNLDDYPILRSRQRSYTDNYTYRSLLYAEDAEHVTLEGRGTIDGRGAAFRGRYLVRPYLIRIIGCRNVAVRGITLRDSPMWVQHYLACDDVRIEGITVRSRCNANNDGIDIDGCHRVVISGCNISSGDDAIVLKSTLPRRCEDVVIADCVLSSACNALKLGTESTGGFENIVIRNCAIYDTRLAGLALEMVDGGVLQRVNVSGLMMRHVQGPIFVRLGNRARPYRPDAPKPGMGKLRGVRISHVLATGANQIGCSVTGLPGHPAQDIALEDIHIQFEGGGEAALARRAVPERANRYPEYSMFGKLPAYGFYCRHVRGLRLRDVRVDWMRPDARPALVCDDVERLDVIGFEGAGSPDAPAWWQWRDVRDAFAEVRRLPVEPRPWWRIEGARTQAIRAWMPGASGATRGVVLGRQVEASGVQLITGGARGSE